MPPSPSIIYVCGTYQTLGNETRGFEDQFEIPLALSCTLIEPESAKEQFKLTLDTNC